MEFLTENTYHLYNRGNAKKRIFFSQSNYHYFLEKVRKELGEHAELLAYCLMPNHFHLMIHVSGRTTNSGRTTMDPLCRKIGTILSSYTRAINVQENRTGSLFQQKTKAKELTDSKDYPGLNYAAICMHYIHQNPLRAGLSTRLGDWPFSSYREYLDPNKKRFCNHELAAEITGIDLKNFKEESHFVLDEQQFLRIRKH